jgi:hypothetical protein
VFFAKVKAEAEVSPHERRRSIRQTTVMQLAKIRLASGQEELCLLRDVSPEGVKAEIYIRIDEGACVQIELRTGHRIDGRIAWSEGKMVGVAFDEPTLMTVMLAHCSFDDRLGKLRPPRLRVDLRGVLKVGVQEKVVRIGNISQAGLQIAAPEPLHVTPACTIALPGLAPRAAMIRWCREGQAGLMLVTPLDFATFAEWRATLAGAAPVQ